MNSHEHFSNRLLLEPLDGSEPHCHRSTPYRPRKPGMKWHVQYLLQSRAPSSPLSEPRRILVVMDLNGTILCRPSADPSTLSSVCMPPRKDYCLSNFYVAIWPSARPDNVDKHKSDTTASEYNNQSYSTWFHVHSKLPATHGYVFLSCTVAYNP